MIKKSIIVILNYLFSVIKVFLSWLKKHILLIQLAIATCCIVFCSILLYVWYRIPQKTVTYTTQTLGCIGRPKCKILAVMNYGNGDVVEDSIGFSIKILHPFKENAPYLFRGNVFGEDVARKDRYIKEYEPLCYNYSSAIDSISTLYKSIITLESNLYNGIKPKTKEVWSNEREVAIWHKPIIVKNKTNTENESWFYLKRKTWDWSVDTLCLEHRLLNSYDNFFPKWSSKGDVSKLNFKLKIENYGFIECDEIMIRFNGPYNLSSITMEPDEKGYDYIRFTNPFKLEVISKNGLGFYASFPIPEKIQQARIAAIMIIIPILISWLLYILNRMVFTRSKSKKNN